MGSSIDEFLKNYRQTERFRWAIIVFAYLLMIFMCMMDVVFGPFFLSFVDVFRAVLAFENVSDVTAVIVWDLRLPMALMACLAGGLLSAGGAQFQILFRNPMASPFTLGLAAASGFGASLMIAFVQGGLWGALHVPFGAFMMTLLAGGILFVLAAQSGMTSYRLILGGVALVFFFQACISFIQYVSSPEVSQQILFWIFGSLTKADWFVVGITAVVALFCLPFLFFDAWRLNAVNLGNEYASGMGINLRYLRMRVFLFVSLITAVVTSFVGVIGFIGLVCPHMARMLVGEDHRFVLPLSVAIGAIFLSFSSILSKVVIPGVLFPIGIVTAFMGVPFFIAVMLSEK